MSASSLQVAGSKGLWEPKQTSTGQAALISTQSTSLRAVIEQSPPMSLSTDRENSEKNATLQGVLSTVKGMELEGRSQSTEVSHIKALTDALDAKQRAHQTRLEGLVNFLEEKTEPLATTASEEITGDAIGDAFRHISGGEEAVISTSQPLIDLTTDETAPAVPDFPLTPTSNVTPSSSGSTDSTGPKASHPKKHPLSAEGPEAPISDIVLSSTLQNVLNALPKPEMAGFPNQPLLLSGDHLRSSIGGNHAVSSVFSRVSEVKQRSQLYPCSELIMVKPSLHQYAPSRGTHGALAFVEGGEFCGEVGKQYPVFRQTPWEDWEYLGEYTVVRHMTVQPEVWREWPVATRKRIVRRTASSVWGTDLLLGKGLSKILNSEKSMSAQLLELFEKEEAPFLRMSWTILECAEYDQGLYDALRGFRQARPEAFQGEANHSIEHEAESKPYTAAADKCLESSSLRKRRRESASIETSILSLPSNQSHESSRYSKEGDRREESAGAEQTENSLPSWEERYRCLKSWFKIKGVTAEGSRLYDRSCEGLTDDESEAFLQGMLMTKYDSDYEDDSDAISIESLGRYRKQPRRSKRIFGPRPRSGRLDYNDPSDSDGSGDPSASEEDSDQ